MKRLPDAQFEIMKVVWDMLPPVTTGMIMKKLEGEKDWKVQTVIVLLNRLIECGFLRTEKSGKERSYYPLVDREEYLQFETGQFIQQYHKNSFKNLVNTLYDGKKLSERDIEYLKQFIEERGK